MPTDGERLATLEQALRDLGQDVRDVTAQVERSRTRLHNLEGFAQAYLDTQKENRRREERQYRRLEQAVQFGGLIMAAAMVMLSVVTLVIHGG